MKTIAIIDATGTIANVLSIRSPEEVEAQADIVAAQAREDAVAQLTFVAPDYVTVVDVPDGETYHAGGIWDADTSTYTPPIHDMTPDIAAHALALKIGATNAMKTDGGPDYPVTPEALAAIRETYTDIINEASSKTVMGETVTDEEKTVVGLIRAGFAYFKSVDAAAAAISAAGDAVDPIHTDTRWP